jgi:hypothetical protein
MRRRSAASNWPSKWERSPRRTLPYEPVRVVTHKRFTSFNFVLCWHATRVPSTC